MKTSISSAGGIIFRVSGEICFPIDFGGDVVYFAFGAAPILVSMMVLGTALGHKYIKRIELEPRRIIPGISPAVLVLAGCTITSTARLCYTEAEKSKKVIICELENRMTVSTTLEVVLTLTAKNVETFVVENQRKLTVWTGY